MNVYLIRGHRRRLVQTDELRVFYVEKRRVKRIREGPLGPMRMMEHAGWDRSQLRILARNARDGRGLKLGTNADEAVCPKTAAGLKTVLRKVRPEEEATLNKIDLDIVAMQDQIKELRSKRELAVREAWSKAHVVRLNELEVEEPQR